MRVLRRVTALVTALLLLHLTVAGTSAACLTHVQGAGGPGSDHSGMSMDSSIRSTSGTNNSAVASKATSTQLAAGADWHEATPEGSGCPAHNTTRPCDSMVACGSVVLGTAIAAVTIADMPVAGTIPSRVLTPPTRTTAPELPPPRA